MTRSDLEQALAKELIRVLRRLRGRVKQIEKGVDLRTATPETPEKIIHQALLDILPSFTQVGVVTQPRRSPSSNGQ